MGLGIIFTPSTAHNNVVFCSMADAYRTSVLDQLCPQGKSDPWRAKSVVSSCERLVQRIQDK